MAADGLASLVAACYGSDGAIAQVGQSGIRRGRAKPHGIAAPEAGARGPDGRLQARTDKLCCFA